ncbi:hypothetical protein C1645_851053 [Glomus cerebriforme]|uniref:Uncharacterized protein n=1 Tax=Glomus cerebriforme TaxID=658196 RepID=A0A397SUJ8_9GLOM|nr:hypothetical protein C1645_851053 [Glomus cerebriforme]
MVPSEEFKKKHERELEELKKCMKELKEDEKVLYSKECVAHSINFVVDKANKEVTTLKDYERFSCYLATILARDKEVVAVWLRVLSDHCEIYLSKNFAWESQDVKYINKIMMYLKDISKNAPAYSDRNESAFAEAITVYCSAKFESRYKKLRDYIKKNGSSEHVKSFKNFFSANINYVDRTSMIMTSHVCNMYYKKIKDKNDEKVKFSVLSEFLELIKKVGSYAGSIIGIVECARNTQYKSLFSNSIVIKRSPVIINNQSIYSWKNIIRRFIDEDKYEDFMDRCLRKTNVTERRSRAYTDHATKQQQPLDGGDVKQYVYLHAEMNILSYIIDNKIYGREFIAVSKKCCYLCELYIDFAQKQGYDIIVPGNHKKIYSGWKLPHVKDDNFKISSLRYILENLNRIIGQKLEHYTRSLPAGPDNGGNSPNSSNSDGRYMVAPFKKVSKKVKMTDLLFDE